MKGKLNPSAPTWVDGNNVKAYIGLSADTMKRKAKLGDLIPTVHFMRMGHHQNAKYLWHTENCLQYFAGQSLPSRPQKKS